MGIETAFIAAAALSAGGKLLAGMSERDAQKNRAGVLEDNARYAALDATNLARQRTREIQKFAANQKISFLKNGVTLEGSPALTLAETYALGQEEVNAITQAGTRQANAYWREAKIAKKQGRAAMISGLFGAADSGVQAYGIGSSGGLFGGGTGGDGYAQGARA